MGNIIIDGVMMMVMLFIIIVAYIVLSSPFDDMMSGFENINSSQSDVYVEQGTSMSRTVFNIVFAAMGIIAIVWFIVRVFSREPDWGFEH